MRSISIWTDGPGSQFKNAQMVAFAKQLRENFSLDFLIWNFFATSHGKGPCDSLGGALKRMAKQTVLSRKVQIQSAAQMAMGIKPERIQILVLNDVDNVYQLNNFGLVMDKAKKVS
jgi:hypothetical protein